MVSVEEFRKIRDFISSKSISLMNHESKCSSQTGFPISNYTFFPISNEKYYSISTNTFCEIINRDVLKSATCKNPEKFGTGNANDVVEAILLATETILNGIYYNYKNRLSDFTEFLKKAHCYIVKQNLDGKLNENILRIDLFRKIELNKTDNNKFDFTGGLFHSFKHFSIRDINLSVGKDKVELHHPIRILEFVIKAFYCSDLEELPMKNKFTSNVDFDKKYNLKCIFYHENNTNVYFLDTIRKDKKPLT